MVVTSAPRRRRRRSSVSPADLLPSNVYTAYLRVSTREQAESGAGLDSQRAIINLYAAVHGLEIREWRIDAGETGKDLERPDLQRALGDVRTGHTRGIIVAKLDRLSRSVIDFRTVLTEALAENWNLVLVDLNVDLHSPNGKLVAGLIATIAEWEADMISRRTKEGLAAKREQGVRLGRPREASDELLATVVGLYGELGNFSAAARRLNEQGQATVQGGKKWYPASVRDLVYSQDGKALMASLDVDAA